MFVDDGADTMRMFCGRRKTDLTPTVPIRRDNYDMSMMSRSTSRGSGRVYSSMTRLERSRSPGGNLSLSQHQHQPQRLSIKDSRSKSTTHLSSTGLKLTRTEILRQALAEKKDSAGKLLFRVLGSVKLNITATLSTFFLPFWS